MFIKKYLERFRKNTVGATIMEYALIAALISVVAIAAVRATGVNLKCIYLTISDSVKNKAYTKDATCAPSPTPTPSQGSSILQGTVGS